MSSRAASALIVEGDGGGILDKGISGGVLALPGLRGRTGATKEKLLRSGGGNDCRHCQAGTGRALSIADTAAGAAPTASRCPAVAHCGADAAPHMKAAACVPAHSFCV